MPDNSRVADAGGAIDLARTEDFTLGALKVQPSLRQVETAPGSQTLEPRVMQVLVALADRRGAVVSRDELIQRCWDGRAVSEDAINRCIMRVRRLGQSSGAFALETITRVGYRLSVAPAEAVSVAGGAASSSSSDSRNAASVLAWLSGRRPVAIGIVAGAIVLLASILSLAVERGQRPALEPSIAVLPFGGVEEDSQRAYLGRGIAGEIIEILSQLKGMQVIARNSSFTFPSDADPREVGKQLGVAHVLTGEVNEENERIRVSAVLADTASGRVIWSRSDTTSYTPQNVLGIQKKIAENVAGAMSIAFNVPASSRLTGGSTQNLEAYDSYLRGLDLWWSGRGGAQTVDAFARATQLDPNYAEAWAGQAFSSAFVSLSQMTPEQALAQQAAAFEMAERAVKLAPELSVTQATFGALSTTQKKWKEAEAATLEALRISRGELPLMHRQMLLTRVGRGSEAYEVMQELKEVDPLISVGGLGTIGPLSAAGRNDELLEAAERYWFNSNGLSSQNYGLMARINAGQPAAAIRESLENLSRHPDRGAADLAAAVLAVFDEPEKARAVLRSAYEDKSFQHFSKWEIIPFLAAWYDDADLVLQVWRDELPVNTMRTIFIWGDAFSKVRARPEFKQLARDIGFVDYWRAHRWANKCRPLSGDDFECQ